MITYRGIDIERKDGYYTWNYHDTGYKSIKDAKKYIDSVWKKGMVPAGTRLTFTNKIKDRYQIKTKKNVTF